jgi:hypothetical protein
MYLKKNSRAQIWIETAIYTAIGLTVIFIIVAAATPQVEKMTDSGIIKQTTTALGLLNDKMLEAEQAPANIRRVDFTLTKGRLEIDSENNAIRYILEDTRLKLTEPGEKINDGIFVLETIEKSGSRFDVIVSVDYDTSVNITYKGNEELKVLQRGATPYQIYLWNKGDNLLDQKTHIDIDII